MCGLSYNLLLQLHARGAPNCNVWRGSNPRSRQGSLQRCKTLSLLLFAAQNMLSMNNMKGAVEVVTNPEDGDPAFQGRTMEKQIVNWAIPLITCGDSVSNAAVIQNLINTVLSKRCFNNHDTLPWYDNICGPTDDRSHPHPQVTSIFGFFLLHILLFSAGTVPWTRMERVCRSWRLGEMRLATSLPQVPLLICLCACGVIVEKRIALGRGTWFIHCMCPLEMVF